MSYDEEKRPILLGDQKKRSSGMLSALLDSDPSINTRSTPEGSASGCLAQTNEFNWMLISLIAGVVFFSSATMIGWPVWLSALATHQSDVFAPVVLNPIFATIVCLVIALIVRKANVTGCNMNLYPFHLKPALLYGVLAAFASVFHSFCGLPSRTPAFIQAFSFIAILPTVAITRYLIRRKGFAWRQGVCLMVIMVAIALTGVSITATPGRVPGSPLIPGPELDNGTLPTQPSNVSVTVSPLAQTWPTFANVLWPLGFAFGYVLIGIAIAVIEEPLKFGGANAIVFCMYCQLMTFTIVVFLFWFDLIPGFGMVSSLREFRHNVHRGAKCLLNIGGSCGPLPWRGWLYMLSTTTLTLLEFFLVLGMDGAVFPVVMACSAVPVAGLFWTLISDTGSAFVWLPVYFGGQTVLVFIALIVIGPVAVLFRYYGLRADREKFEEL